MSRNPIINALSAAGYIFLVVGVMNIVTKPLRYKPDTFLAPITILFMLTLSVTVMGYLFFYQPLQFFIQDKKKQAVDLFIKTVGIFALCTAVVLTFLFLGRF